MLNAIIGIHVFVSICLIIAILLHSGKGTGLSETFGSAMPSTFSGTTIIERNLNRITVALAIIFTITAITLYIIY
jgi:preprotein translocase subunit SecG